MTEFINMNNTAYYLTDDAVDLDSENGLRIVLSPVQLAAILSDNTITEEETWSNRILGGAGLAAGVVELIGAGGLCLAPDPTTLTKAACVIVGAHSLDVMNASVSQMMTGRETTTETYRAAVELAKEFGADNYTASEIGLTVDIAVPLSFASMVGAIRVTSVRVGRIKLIEHDSPTGLKPGGHTLAKHVGLSEPELRARILNSKGRLREASTFYNQDVAEKVISKALKNNQMKITTLLKYTPKGVRQEIDYISNTPVGFGFIKGSENLQELYKVRIVLTHSEFNGKLYYILTAFPTY
ncbi:RNase A-like domain-containing protein [Photorhabdus asymbiotica]|uniref:RNase A-like domain-containing protein n=1 Tax=Photorhabdus asymbiotica TaxID=291112 RepID=UPI003DA7051B